MGAGVGAGVGAGAGAGLHYARVRRGITGKGASPHYTKDENSHA